MTDAFKVFDLIKAADLPESLFQFDNPKASALEKVSVPELIFPEYHAAHMLPYAIQATMEKELKQPTLKTAEPPQWLAAGYESEEEFYDDYEYPWIEEEEDDWIDDDY